MNKTLQILNKAIIEDAKNGKAQLRTLSVPIKAKRKDGNDIHKLPAPYKCNEEIENEFKKDYSKIFNKFITTRLKEILQ